MRLIPLVLAIALLIAPAAHAAYPGANGDVAFVRGAGSAAEIWAQAPDGSQRQLTSGNGWEETAPAYSPDGTRIAFVSREGGDADVYVMPAGGGAAENLTDDNATDDLDPTWSPDDARIAFSSSRGGNVDVYVTAADGTGAAAKLAGLGSAPDTDPAWSPDGATIAYETTQDGENAEIYAIDADGTDPRNLTGTTGVSNLDPSWSPDGARIAFTRSEPNQQIWAMDADGGDQVRLTTAGDIDNRPAFSPDGTRIVWTVGQQRLRTMAPDGGDQQHLTPEQGNSAPDWQPLAEAEPTPTPTPGATATPGPGAPPPRTFTGLVTALFEGGGPPAPTCEKSSIRFGDVEVLASCFAAKGRAGAATGRIRVNGLDILAGSGEVVVDPEARTITSARAVSVFAGPQRLYQGRIDWNLSRGRFELPIENITLKFVRVTGTATVATAGAGNFRIALLPRIDTVFSTIAEKLSASAGRRLPLPEITGDMALRTENARGLSLESLSLGASSVPIGPLELQRLALRFEPAAGTWLGTTTLRLPGPEPRVTADAAVTIRDGRFERAGVSYRSRPGTFGFGVRLEHLGLDLRTDPFAFGGRMALTAGPGEIVKSDGTFDFTAGDPSRLRLTGRTEVGPVTGTTTFSHLSTGRSELTGDVGLSVRDDVGLTAAVRGVLDQRVMLLLGSAEVRVLGLRARGEGLVSNLGTAGCIPVFASGGRKGGAGAVRVGFGYRFRDRRLDLMGGSCDVAPWSPVALGGKAGTSARSAQVPPVASVELPGGLPATAFEATGTVAPPRVTVTGPGGVRATTPADPAATRDGDVVFLRDASARRTYVLVPAPRRGAWSLTLEPGSSPVAAVRRAAGLAAPSVKARVTGKRHRRTLQWRLSVRRGQVVRFVEEGPQTARTVATTRSARGSVRFRPGDGRRGRRSIVAVVEQDGVVRDRLVAGRYTAPAPARPGTPRKLTLRRRGGALVVKWRRAGGARGYRVHARLSDGRRLLVATTRHTLRIPAFGVRESAKVSVTGVSGAHEGRNATRRLPPGGM